MASIYILHIFIVLILAKDIYGFPKLNFKRRVKILQLNTTYRPGGEIIIHAVLNKFNRTHEAITANCTIREDVGQQFHVAVEGDIWGDGGWKRHIINYEQDNPCTGLKFVLGTAWEKFCQQGNATTDCPVKKGYYELKDYYVDATNVPLIFAAGLFKLIAIFTKNQIFVIRVQVIVEIEALYT